MSTTTPLGPEFYKDLIPWMFKAFDDGKRQAFRMIWNILILFLKQHYISIPVLLIALLLVSYLIAIGTGRWGVFGSITYHYLYALGILIVGFILGPEVFASDYFEVFLVFLYIACFILVGVILHKTGLKK